MTIIVTGGAGFIGSNFIFHMLKKYPDYRIICLDCLTYAGNLSTLEPVMDNPNFRFVKESITDRSAVYTCPLTDLTFSLQRKHQSIHQVHIHHQRQEQIYLCLHITEHTDCRLQSAVAQITMAHIIFRKSLYPL